MKGKYVANVGKSATLRFDADTAGKKRLTLHDNYTAVGIC